MPPRDPRHTQKPAFAALLLCAGFAASLAACGGQESDTPVQPVAQKVVDTDRYSGVPEARTALVSDATAWADLWGSHKQGQDVAAYPPTIDFSRQMVVAVFAGERADSCSAVLIQKVYRTTNRLVVEYTEPQPDPSAVCSAVITHPSQMVAIPRGPGPVEFIKNTVRQ
jgi:hypothetical protein